MTSPQKSPSLALAVLLITAVLLACAIPLPSGPSEEAPPEPGEGPIETEVPVAPPPEPLVVTHLEPNFHLYSLDGTLVETRSAAGMSWVRPNNAQVVGDAIYYVDSAGSSLSGVVRWVTSSGSDVLDFTQADTMASLTFAVTPDESRIAWTHSTWEADGVVSSLWMANIDGSDAQLVVESTPATQPDTFYALEVVGWTTGGDLVYAWQISGIGGYILFFGYSSLYRYSPASGTTTELAPIGPATGAPCWNGISPDGAFAAGACGADRSVIERDLASGTETGFAAFPEQGQAGAATYSASGNRLAYAIARGDPENESGQLIVRLNRGEAPAPIATQAPGHFHRITWVDDDRMVVGYSPGEDAHVDLVGVEGTRSLVGDGNLVGLMWPAGESAAASGLAQQIQTGELVVEDLTANGDIAGPGIDLVVHNPGPSDIETWIPCGTVFMPDDSEDQRLMVVQEVRATVPAGGQVSLSAHVVCIDSSSSAPSEGAGYALGPMQTGDLLRLAQCACREDLADNPMDSMSLLLAGWFIASEGTLGQVGPGAEEALEQIVGEGAGQMLAGMEEVFREPAEMWMDRCGIGP